MKDIHSGLFQKSIEHLLQAGLLMKQILAKEDVDITQPHQDLHPLELLNDSKKACFSAVFDASLGLEGVLHDMARAKVASDLNRIETKPLGDSVSPTFDRPFPEGTFGANRVPPHPYFGIPPQAPPYVMGSGYVTPFQGFHRCEMYGGVSPILGWPPVQNCGDHPSWVKDSTIPAEGTPILPVYSEHTCPYMVEAHALRPVHTIDRGVAVYLGVLRTGIPINLIEVSNQQHLLAKKIQCGADKILATPKLIGGYIEVMADRQVSYMFIDMNEIFAAKPAGGYSLENKEIIFEVDHKVATRPSSSWNNMRSPIFATGMVARCSVTVNAKVDEHNVCQVDFSPITVLELLDRDRNPLSSEDPYASKGMNLLNGQRVVGFELQARRGLPKAKPDTDKLPEPTEMKLQRRATTEQFYIWPPNMIEVDHIVMSPIVRFDQQVDILGLTQDDESIMAGLQNQTDYVIGPVSIPQVYFQMLFNGFQVMIEAYALDMPLEASAESPMKLQTQQPTYLFRLGRDSVVAVEADNAEERLNVVKEFSELFDKHDLCVIIEVPITGSLRRDTGNLFLHCGEPRMAAMTWSPEPPPNDRELADAFGRLTPIGFQIDGRRGRARA